VGYRLVRGIIRILLWLFYRRIEIAGRDRIPTSGPVIVAANHHNSLVDAMLIVASFPRPIRVLAKAPLFRHPLIGPFLWLMGGVPVHRRIDAGDDPQKNAEMFASVVAALRAGGVILIFPEGRSQPQPILLPLRTGTARILLDAAMGEGARPDVTLLPVGLVFHDPGTFRSASALVKIGEPVSAADLLELGRREPEPAVRALTDRLAGAIRAQIVEAEDQHTLELLAVLETAWWEEAARRGEGPAGPRDAAQSLSWRQRVARGAAFIAESQPDRVIELRRRLEEYRSRLDEVGVTSEQLGQPYTAGLVSRYVVENFLWLALGLPLAVWGMVCHCLPYWLTGRAVRWIGATAEEEATDKMAAGAVIYPVCWAAEGWLTWRMAGLEAVLVFALVLLPSGLLALAWWERLDQVARQARAFFRFLGERDLHHSLMRERQALVEEVRGLAARVPPAVTAPGGPGGR
jgi:glycerol-3-phosphate O-acyltransferase / dihydroxyacetone phosphate acyltransferase